MLSETWSSDQDDISLDGYFYYNYPRNYKHPDAKRMSGGLGIFIRRELKDGVDIWSYTDDVIAWVILKKDFFGIQSDIYVANVYIVPEGSTYIRHKQRVLMHGHQGWNVRHGLCHIYMIYVYIWVVYSFCLFCCLFIIVTTQFVALYKPCKPKPSTYDPPPPPPPPQKKKKSNKYAINMQIQTISVSK